MTSVSTHIFVDVTTLLRWKDLAPVGIVRLERLIAGHLRFHSNLPAARYVVWDAGYREADGHESAALDKLLSDVLQRTEVSADTVSAALPKGASPPSRRSTSAARRGARRIIARVPDHLQPLAEQAAWSAATFAVESTRHAKRALQDRKAGTTVRRANVHHRVDFSGGGDLVAVGLGWEYLDHEEMYRLKTEHGVRIHMPAFDLIPVVMPQMNAGQSHLVHRYYAEMAHYADSITSISDATRGALSTFFISESLPTPHLAVNQLPGIEATAGAKATRHRFDGNDFVLSVSTVEIRKNHILLAKIWTEFVREGLAVPKMVVVGRIGWDVQELRRWVDNAPELDGIFEICTDVDDDELMALYRDSMFTVLPSRIEGWGLPITEALDYGKVCIHSTDPAQFEASQNLMPAFHPDDFLGWKAEILRMATDAEYRTMLEQRIIDNYVRRSPEAYCRDFEAILATRRSAGENT